MCFFGGFGVDVLFLNFQGLEARVKGSWAFQSFRIRMYNRVSQGLRVPGLGLLLGSGFMEYGLHKDYGYCLVLVFFEWLRLSNCQNYDSLRNRVYTYSTRARKPCSNTVTLSIELRLPVEP